jgi:ATP-dependent DNA ligase
MLHPPLAPMEASVADALPSDPGWQYEPKWDGFRCLVFRNQSDVHLQSKAGQPLTRYFPEVVAFMRAIRRKTFCLDGELVIPIGGGLDFNALLQRIHPAASRVAKLSQETPAVYIAFDLLSEGRRSLVGEPLTKRRKQLEQFAKALPENQVRLSPATTDLTTAKRWWTKVGGDLDGIVCKRLAMPYRAGLRDGMVKVKKHRTIDCVVGGFRYATGKRTIGSLLLGLYDAEGQLDHVGFTSGLTKMERDDLTPKLEKLVSPPGFTGIAPGRPSRWSTDRTTAWQRLKTKLVVEVEFDHFTGGRFRHGVRLLRWRPDKKPRQCTFEQVRPPKPNPPVSSANQ